MIDTHTHIYFSDFNEDIDEVMKRCKENGVSHLILPNVDEDTVSLVKDFHARYPHVTSMAMGLHPTEVKEGWEEVITRMEEDFQGNDYVAVGEVGMDLYWDSSNIEMQKEAFERQLRLAMKLQLPVIIHSRNAFEETMEVIEKVKPDVPLIFHSFTGGIKDVRRIRQGCDPYFGINGVVTYKNASELREALPEIGLKKILLETDSPYLTPVPHRGKRNDSSYLIHIRNKVAETLGATPEETEAVTDENARKIFRL